jgi:hypothetical protein
VINFASFLHIVRHIRRSQGKAEDPASVELAARDVFVISGLRIEDGYVTEVSSYDGEGDVMPERTWHACMWSSSNSLPNII